jgi:DNA-binding GntR family transcriptional regulator
MPRAERHEPLHLQIAAHYKEGILDGRIADGEQLPPIRDIADQWEVGQETAARAIAHLKTEGLVRTVHGVGSFAVAGRVKYGPQQRFRAVEFPAAERVEVLSAELVAAPPYIVPVLGPLEVKPGFWPVLRREWVTYEDSDVPFMLSVSWCQADASRRVPELLQAVQLPDPGGAAKMIAARSGRLPAVRGRFGVEARRPLDDGREMPLLGVAADAPVQAVVYVWWAGEEVLEYREDVLREGKVIAADMEP